MNKEVLADGTFILNDPVQLPETLDMLIVGGGPAGTAAAFRAKELGLAALVIDYDDLMKRIRDYAKDKLILPHFGGGDQMQFPKGGKLLSALAFDPVDKDDMCVQWKGYYRTYNVPAKIGVELTGFTYTPEGLILAQGWNHRTRNEEQFRTKHLVFAIGRGVPRRFNIPGNTDGIAYRLDDAANYLGRPVCIIGGGTSAAEAVISISNAKSSSDDTCPVYWSYRGDKMPKVSRALSDVFFDAYVGNGNIRYYPKSEPVAIVSGPDRNEYLTIRVDRRHIEGRSIETTHLEFPKTNCIACIGEDIPEAFLNSVGIHMATGGPKNKKRMVVTPLLETQQPNVYFIGDILSQVHFETDNHAANPPALKEIRHRGNIKSALRDGVFVAEVVKQKLDGASTIHVELDFLDEKPAAAPAAPAPAATVISVPDVSSEAVMDGSGPVEKEVSDLAPRLIRLTPGDIEDEEHTLRTSGKTSIGQSTGDIRLPIDSSTSLIHAVIEAKNGKYVLHDEGSSAGVFYRLMAGVLKPIKPGTLLQLGRQFLMFGSEGRSFTMAHYDRAGKLLKTHKLSDGTIVVGRDAPDITLDSKDTILSRRHLIVSVKGPVLQVKDPGSLNKTYIRVNEPTPLQNDDVFRIGPHLFRMSTEAELPKDSTVFVVPPKTKPAPEPTIAIVSPPPPTSNDATLPPSTSPLMPPTPSPTAPPGGAPSLQFNGVDGTFSASASDSVLEIARSNGVPIKYECESGSCGYDPIRIISGEEHLNEVDDEGEAWTLEEICHLEPGNKKGQCRLACMTKVTGPVVVEVVKK